MGAVLEAAGRRHCRRSTSSVGRSAPIGLFGIFELIRNRKDQAADGAASTARPKRWPRSGKFFRENGSLHASSRWNTFYTNPPLCINEEQLREAFAIIDEGLEITDRAVV